MKKEEEYLYSGLILTFMGGFLCVCVFVSMFVASRERERERERDFRAHISTFFQASTMFGSQAFRTGKNLPEELKDQMDEAKTKSEQWVKDAKKMTGKLAQVTGKKRTSRVDAAEESIDEWAVALESEKTARSVENLQGQSFFYFYILLEHIIS